MTARDLIPNKGQKSKYIFKKGRSLVSVYEFEQFFIVYSSFNNEAKKYSISGLPLALKMLEKQSTSKETIKYVS